MKTFEFTLVLTISDSEWDADTFEDKLFESGCDDALVFSGRRGVLALEFNRNALSAEQAILSALENIKTAFPTTELLEIKPDLVTLSDIAKLLGQSRQNIRKLEGFPPPIITAPSPLWHLYQVTQWYEKNKHQVFEKTLVAVAKAAWRQNAALEQKRLASI
ncbi:helix-turn-helix transcriptional regulator [Magnetococcales bacterium HHB-1]